MNLIALLPLGHLDKIKFDRCRTSKNADDNPELALLGPDFINDSIKIGKGPINNFYVIAHIELEFGFRFERPFINSDLQILNIFIRNR